MKPKHVTLFLFFFAFALRAWSAHHGHPFSYHNDEHWIFRPAFKMLLNGTWDPGWYVYPPLLTFLFKLIAVPFLWIFPIDLQMPENWNNFLMIVPHQFPVLYLGRLMIAAFGAATVALIYRILLKYTGEKISATVALMYAVCPSVVYFSSYLRPEPLMIFFLTLTFYFLTIYQSSTKYRVLWVWICGLSLGFAVGSKYNASFFLLTLLLFIFLCEPSRKLFIKNSFRAFIGMLLGFLISAPQFIWKTKNFLYEIGHNYSVYSQGHAGNMGALAEKITYYINKLLPNDKIGIVFALFFLSIAVLLCIFKYVKKDFRNVLIASTFFAVSYIAFILYFTYRADRVIAPIHPFLFISTGMAFSGMNIVGSKKIKQMTMYLLIFAFICTSWFGLSYLKKCNQPLPQDYVTHWIDKNAPERSVILKEFNSPFIDPTKYFVGSTYATALLDPAELMQMNPDFIILNDFIASSLRDIHNPAAEEMSKWLWSRPIEFEDIAHFDIPLAEYYRVIQFRKYNEEYMKTFGITAK